MELVQEGLTSDSIWRTRDGVLIAIKDMTDSHLLNTIRVLRGISPKGTTFRASDVRRRQWVNAMANEAYSRGLEIDEVRPEELIHIHE